MDGCGLFKLFSLRKKTTSTTSMIAKEHTPDEQARGQTLTAPNTSVQSQGSGESNPHYRYHNGRPYHNEEDIIYIVPVDEEENDRIHRQHWIFKILCGKNYGAPIADELEKGINVLDAGCGSGTWTLEIANAYPKSTIHGTDIWTRYPEDLKPANCNFKTVNFSVPGLFPDNYFGYIHQRFVISALPAQDWEKVIQEHVRTLAPGGWIEMLEPKIGFSVENAPPKAKKLLSTYLTLFEIKGLFGRIDEHLEDMFKRAGLVNIHTQAFDFPFGDETQLGLLAWANVCDAFRAVIPAVTENFPDLETIEKQNQLLDEARKEAIEHHSVFTFCRFYGQKPLSNNDE